MWIRIESDEACALRPNAMAKQVCKWDHLRGCRGNKVIMDIDDPRYLVAQDSSKAVHRMMACDRLWPQDALRWILRRTYVSTFLPPLSSIMKTANPSPAWSILHFVGAHEWIQKHALAAAGAFRGDGAALDVG